MPDDADGAGGKRTACGSCGLVHREGVGTLRHREPARYAGEQGVRGDAGEIRLRGGATGDAQHQERNERAGAGGKIIRTSGLENHHAQLGRGGAG